MAQSDPQQAGFQPDYATNYAGIVNPDRVVVLPGYSLRLLAHNDLTPRELSLWLAFRQGVYATWKDGGKPQAVTANIPHQWLLPFAMMSRSSYWNEVSGKDSLCGGLVQAIPSQGDGTGHRQIANANRYQVSMSPRLTRRDMGILQDILTSAAGEGEGRLARVEAKLRELLNLNPGAHLDNSRATPAQVEGWPSSLVEVIRRILGLKIQDVPASLALIADRVQERILAGYGKLVISHYFLRTVVPALELSQAQAWTVIALRDRAWFDYATGERWPYTIVHGGLEEVGAMTGSSVKSVRRWLAEPGFMSLVSIADTSGVTLPEFWQPGTMVFEVNHVEPVGPALDKVGLGSGQSWTRPGTKLDSQMDKVGLGSGQSWTPLNSLINLINRHHRKKTQNETRPDADFCNLDDSPVFVPPLAAAGEDFSKNQANDFERLNNADDWSLDALMRVNAVSRKKFTEMRRTGVSGQAFASWIAEAFSRQGIDRPIALAVVSSLDHPTGAPGIYAELFTRPRAEVLELIAQAIASYPVTEPVIRKLSTERRRMLYQALGGDKTDIPEPYVSPVQLVFQGPAKRPAPTPVEIPEHVRAKAAEIKARFGQGGSHVP
jgi:hypothetical protein